MTGRKSGARITPGIPAMMNEKANEEIKWYLRPAVIIILLFFVLGPFALPLLYQSPKFSRSLKVLLTVLIILGSAYLIFLIIKTGREVAAAMEGLQKIL
ncbi:hypothetical protein ACFL5U_03035 [Candidatus Margulisiibacteriota bacterium]